MATDMRRFTISITSDMDIELDKLKKEIYYKNTQNDMIRDLIIRGLHSLKAEKVINRSKNGKFDKCKRETKRDIPQKRD